LVALILTGLGYLLVTKYGSASKSDGVHQEQAANNSSALDAVNKGNQSHEATERETQNLSDTELDNDLLKLGIVRRAD
jgi:hypothetical protein